MFSQTLRKKFVSEHCFNPFCDKFSYDLCTNKLKDFAKKVDSEAYKKEKFILDKLTDVVFLLPHFNQWYLDYYTHTKEALDKIDLPIIDMINFQLVAHNRTVILVSKTEGLNIKQSSVSEIYRIKYLASESKIDAGKRESLEALVDSLMVGLNFYRYFVDTKTKTGNNSFVEVVSFCHNSDLRSQLYHSIKSAYSEYIWGNGYMSFSDNELRFQWFDINTQANKLIGFYRLNRNSATIHYSLLNKYSPKTDSLNGNETTHIIRTNNTRIKQTLISDNFVKIELEPGLDKTEMAINSRMISEVLAYYNFLPNLSIPSSPSLGIYDLLELYMPLRQLANRLIADFTVSTEVFSFEDFKKFPTRIKFDNLVEYLEQRTIYNKEQIEFFIQLISSQNITDRINLWDKFFVRHNEDLYFSLYPISTSLIVYCLDNWMELSGIDLDFRGNVFEKYLKKTLTSLLSEKGYQFTIPNESKLTLPNGKYEEVDLIITLKSKVILAELKCVKYPNDYTDHHNSEKRIRYGIEQVIRKKNFIMQNKDILKPIIGDITGKEIVPLVITNNPIFTFLSDQNIPVVDYMLIEAYFGDGVIKSTKVSVKGSEVHGIEHLSETKFYNSEDEFGQNFYNCMASPKAVEELRPFTGLKVFPVPLPPEVTHKVLIDTVDFHTNPETVSMSVKPV